MRARLDCIFHSKSSVIGETVRRAALAISDRTRIELLLGPFWHGTFGQPNNVLFSCRMAIMIIIGLLSARICDGSSAEKKKRSTRSSQQF